MKTLGSLGMAVSLAIALTPRLYPSPADGVEKQRVLQEVKRTVERDYYDESLGGVPWATVTKQAEADVAAAADEVGVYAAINRMLAVFRDGHTGVSSPASVRSRKSPSRLALGFDARYLDGKLAVTAVRPGSAVAGFGVGRGWVVRAIGGAAVPETQERFGPWIRELGVGELCAAGEVAVTFEDHTGQDRFFRGACTAIEKDNRLLARREGTALILAFDRFDAASAEWFDRMIDSNLDAKQLVLDLRENTGGTKSALLQIAARLWPSKQLLGRSISRRGRREEWAAGGVRPFGGRVAVLIDHNTQSAGEILSAALQDSGRARLFGRKTAGSVLVMVPKPLPDGGELRLSVQDFVTGKGRRLEAQGVMPDEALPLGLRELRAADDQDLARALAAK